MNIKSRQGILVAITSFLLGGFLTYFVTDYIKLKSRTSSLASNNEIRPPNKIVDPFEQMDKIHDQMRKRMDTFFGRSFGHSFGNSAFDIDPFSGSSFTTNNVNINRYEDDQFKYIEISGEGVNKETLQIDISEGLVSISGEIKSRQEDRNTSSSYVSQFNQSFNVPEGVDESNVKIESGDNKLIIKFPIDRI